MRLAQHPDAGKRLQARRLKCDLTQEALAARSGVSRGAISQYESGAFPDVLVALALARALDTTCEQLWSPPPPEPSWDGRTTADRGGE